MADNRKIWQFCSIQSFSTELAQHTYYWPTCRQGKTKGSTLKHFSISVVVPRFINGPCEIPEQLQSSCENKTLESNRKHNRGLRTVRNDYSMFIRMVEPLLL